MTWFFILYMIFSRGFLFYSTPSENLVYSNRQNNRGQVIYIIKETEESSWGAIKAIYKDDSNDSSDSKDKRNKGK